MYWKMFAYTTDGIVVENFIHYNILCVIQFVLFYFNYSCDVVILLMLCIIFLIYFIAFHYVCSIIP